MADEALQGSFSGEPDGWGSSLRSSGGSSNAGRTSTGGAKVAAHQQAARRQVRTENYTGPSRPHDEPNASGYHPVQNVGQVERWGSMLGGAVLLWSGLRTGRLNGLIMAAMGGSLLYRGFTGHCSAYEALGIDSTEHPEATAVPAQQGVKVERTVQINKSPQELYSFWRKLDTLPSVMHHLERVDVLSDTRSRWLANGPLGTSLTWEAEIINDHEPDMLAWRSLPGSQVETAGSVHFQPLPGDRGTAVAVSLKYNPPLGKLAANVAAFLGSGLEQRLAEDLHRFKSTMETGEAPRTAGQPSGRVCS
jgi:uncharacterized membrane protein